MDFEAYVAPASDVGCFVDDAAILAAVRHLECPYLRHTHCMLLVDGLCIRVSDGLEGAPIVDAVRTCGGLDAPSALTAVAEIAFALEALHSQGVAHGLVSPWTVWQGRDGHFALDVAEALWPGWRPRPRPWRQTGEAPEIDAVVPGSELLASEVQPAATRRLRSSRALRAWVTACRAADAARWRSAAEPVRGPGGGEGAGDPDGAAEPCGQDKAGPGEEAEVEEDAPIGGDSGARDTDAAAAAAAAGAGTAGSPLPPLPPGPIAVLPLSASDAAPADWLGVGATLLYALLGRTGADADAFFATLDTAAQGAVPPLAVALVELLVEPSATLRPGLLAPLGMAPLVDHPAMRGVEWAAVAARAHTPAPVHAPAEGAAAEGGRRVWADSLTHAVKHSWRRVSPRAAGTLPGFSQETVEALRGVRWFPASSLDDAARLPGLAAAPAGSVSVLFAAEDADADAVLRALPPVLRRRVDRALRDAGLGRSCARAAPQPSGGPSAAATADLAPALSRSRGAGGVARHRRRDRRVRFADPVRGPPWLREEPAAARRRSAAHAGRGPEDSSASDGGRAAPARDPGAARRAARTRRRDAMRARRRRREQRARREQETRRERQARRGHRRAGDAAARDPVAGGRGAVGGAVSVPEPGPELTRAEMLALAGRYDPGESPGVGDSARARDPGTAETGDQTATGGGASAPPASSGQVLSPVSPPTHAGMRSLRGVGPPPRAPAFVAHPLPTTGVVGRTALEPWERAGRGLARLRPEAVHGVLRHALLGRVGAEEGMAAWIASGVQWSADVRCEEDTEGSENDTPAFDTESSSCRESS